jgi:hypothetical protein
MHVCERLACGSCTSARNLVDESIARNHSTRRALSGGLPVVIGVAIYLVHASAYGDWLVDDAGISIAYAKNLAAGHGLVSQLGASSVEGYSDPLWVFVLAALARAGMLVLPTAPKIVAVALVAATYALLVCALRRVTVRAAIVATLAFVFCSANPSFVIWCTSGLENALYAFGVVALAWLTLRAIESERLDRALFACGVMASLVAMTRPDGVLFAILPPAVALSSGERERRAFLAYAIGFGLPFAAFLGSRFALFHHLVPNTYVAKGGLRVSDLVAFVFPTSGGLAKLSSLLASTFGEIASTAAFGVALFTVGFTARRRRLPAPLAVLLAFTFVALADFMLMPKDKMIELRFATPFFPLYYATFFALVDVALTLARARLPAVSATAIAASLWVACVPDFAARIDSFARAPSIGLSFARRAFVERFDRYATALHVEGGSVLLPDVGAMLLSSRLRVIDLAGLCDETLARTLFHDHDRAAAREYVFAVARPTFIHTDGVWSKAAAFEEDPRLAADYVPIFTYARDEDPLADGHIGGIFVRRDVLERAGGEGVLAPLRAESHRLEAFLEAAPASRLVRVLDSAPFVRASGRPISR